MYAVFTNDIIVSAEDTKEEAIAAAERDMGVPMEDMRAEVLPTTPALESLLRAGYYITRWWVTLEDELDGEAARQ